MENLAKELEKKGVLKKKRVLKAFLSVDRADFVLPEYKNEAYGDYPLPIGYGQTISQPYTVAFMLDLLDPKEGEKILDLGSGSGWTTAILSRAVGANGRVFGIELVPELVEFGRKNILKYSMPQASIEKAGKTMGLKREAPFDKILVSAKSDSYPAGLSEQLSSGGTMVVPVGNSIWKAKKDAGGDIKIETFDGFAFVPLIGQ